MKFGRLARGWLGSGSRLALSLLIMLFGVSACQTGSASGGRPGPPVATVHVVEKSFQIMLEPSVVPPGAIRFVVENEGPDQHEFVIFQSDAPPDELPYDTFLHKVKEDAIPEAYNHDRFPPSQTLDPVINLAPGQYVLICNLAGHYIKGMHARLTVTDQAAPTQTAAVQATQKAAMTAPTATQSNTAQTQAGPPTTRVQISNQKLSVDPAVVPAGLVYLDIQVQGTMTHQMQLVKTDLPADQLPAFGQGEQAGANQLTPLVQFTGLTPGFELKIGVKLELGRYVLYDPNNDQQGLFAELQVNSP